jgi:hypothetical protein
MAPILWPVIFFVFMLPVTIVLGWLSATVPLLGIAAIVYGFFGVTVGDPIVCIVHRFAPKLVPIQRPAFLSLTPVWWVLRPDETEELAISGGFDPRG